MTSISNSSVVKPPLELNNPPLYKITLEPLTLSDIPALNILDLSALNGPMQWAMFGRECRFDSGMSRYRKWMFEEGLNKSKSMWNPGGDIEIWTKAVTDAGELVGAATWVLRQARSSKPEKSDTEKKEDINKKKKENEPPIPEIWNMKALGEWGGWCHKTLDKAIDGKTCLQLNLMTVHPTWQRRGIGKLLMQEGLNIADERGWETFLGATDAGYPFYKQMGFEDIEGIDWDVEKWRPGVLSGSGEWEGKRVRSVIMVRRARNVG